MASGEHAVKVALYARVSTRDKDQDPEVQLSALRDYCKHRGWIVVEEYKDVGSGARDSRPDLDRLMLDAGHRRFDAVVVWKFDRFARSTLHLLRALEFFGRCALDFVSITEQIDTSTPVGKLVYTVVGSVAELERSLIADRVRAGMKYAKDRGKHIGRPRLVANYVKMARLRAQGRSMRQIARICGVGVGSVHKALKTICKEIRENKGVAEPRKPVHKGLAL